MTEIRYNREFKNSLRSMTMMHCDLPEQYKAKCDYNRCPTVGYQSCDYRSRKIEEIKAKKENIHLLYAVKTKENGKY